MDGPKLACRPSSDTVYWYVSPLHTDSILRTDFWFLEPNYKPPASTQGALALAVTAGTVYSTWIEHAAKINGSFPYPFLTIMDFSQRVVMYIVATTMAFVTFRGLNSWHPSAWSKRR